LFCGLVLRLAFCRRPPRGDRGLPIGTLRSGRLPVGEGLVPSRSLPSEPTQREATRASPTIGFVLVRPGSWNRPADAASESIPLVGGSRAKRRPIAAFSRSAIRQRSRRAIGRIPARLFELLVRVIFRIATVILRTNLNRVCGVVKKNVPGKWGLLQGRFARISTTPYGLPSVAVARNDE